MVSVIEMSLWWERAETKSRNGLKGVEENLQLNIVTGATKTLEVCGAVECVSMRFLMVR